MPEKTIVLEAKGITKQFPGVLANDKVDFDLRQGEIHALLGENGAGKTTLMNVLYGLYKPDSGQVLVNGKEIEIQSPKDSIKAGIGMVHQHFMLIPVFTVAENVVLGYETGDSGEIKNAGFLVRGFAFAIDLVIVAALGLLAGGLLSGLIRLFTPEAIDKIVSTVVLSLAVLATGWVYHAVFESSRQLATPGKWMLGLLVTDETHQRITFKRATARYWAKWLSVLTLTAGFIMALFTKKKQALHDVLAKTLVIDKEKEWGVLNAKEAARKVGEISERYNLEVEAGALTGQLPVGIQQRVEIVKTLYRDAKILILDEPTAVLTPQEVDELFKIVHELTTRGVSIIFITHKLKEVLAVADRITVMRGGRVMGTVDPKETNEAKLAAMMVGREVILKVEKEAAKPGESVLKVNDMRVKDGRGLETVRGVSFDVRAGEVLGIAGVQGNGQTELVEALTGLRPAIGGQMIFAGKDMTGKSPRQITETGLAHVPEDRQRHGLVLSMPVADNMVLNTYYRAPYGKWGVMIQSEIDANARKLIEEFDVRTPSPYVPVKKLSGGNQQKVIVARELSHDVCLLVANQPTRGLDVGSIEYIHKEIIIMRDRGVGVLLVSAELDEIMALSDRIAVMYRGQIVAVVDAAQATREKLGLWMAGVHPEE